MQLDPPSTNDKSTFRGKVLWNLSLCCLSSQTDRSCVNPSCRKFLLWWKWWNSVVTFTSRFMRGVLSVQQAYGKDCDQLCLTYEIKFKPLHVDIIFVNFNILVQINFPHEIYNLDTRWQELRRKIKHFKNNQSIWARQWTWSRRNALSSAARH
jgi:hypothetical protein